jgi:hypothetical protein
MPRARKEPVNLRLELADMVTNMIETQKHAGPEKITNLENMIAELQAKFEGLGNEITKTKDQGNAEEPRTPKRGEGGREHNDMTPDKHKLKEDSKSTTSGVEVNEKKEAAAELFKKCATISVKNAVACIEQLGLDIPPQEAQAAEENGENEINSEEFMRDVAELEKQNAERSIEREKKRVRRE